jgi:hypothetical protein
MKIHKPIDTDSDWYNQIDEKQMIEMAFYLLEKELNPYHGGSKQMDALIDRHHRDFAAIAGIVKRRILRKYEKEELNLKNLKFN